MWENAFVRRLGMIISNKSTQGEKREMPELKFNYWEMLYQLTENSTQNLHAHYRGGR